MPTQAQTATREGRRKARLGRDAQVTVGRQLWAMYNDDISQGIPDRFAELLNRLDEQDS
jgi:hypothetical protein